MSTLWQNVQVVREAGNAADVMEQEKSLVFRIIPVRDAMVLVHVLLVEARASYSVVREILQPQLILIG